MKQMAENVNGGKAVRWRAKMTLGNGRGWRYAQKCGTVSAQPSTFWSHPMIVDSSRPSAITLRTHVNRGIRWECRRARPAIVADNALAAPPTVDAPVERSADAAKCAYRYDNPGGGKHNALESAAWATRQPAPLPCRTEKGPTMKIRAPPVLTSFALLHPSTRRGYGRERRGAIRRPVGVRGGVWFHRPHTEVLSEAR